MKARIGANEVITTMMFSYIGKYFVSFMVVGALADGSGIPQTAQLPPNSMLPRLNTFIPGLMPTRVHAGIFIALAMAIVVWATAQVHLDGLRGSSGRLQPLRLTGGRRLGPVDDHQVPVHLGRAGGSRRRGRGHGRLRSPLRLVLQRTRASRASRSRCSPRAIRSE